MCLRTSAGRKKKRGGEKDVWFIATRRTRAHFSKSISAPEGNLHGTIYEAESSTAAQLLGPTEEAVAVMDAGGQTHRVASVTLQLMMFVCIVYDVGSVRFFSHSISHGCVFQICFGESLAESRRSRSLGNTLPEWTVYCGEFYHYYYFSMFFLWTPDGRSP